MASIPTPNEAPFLRKASHRIFPALLFAALVSFSLVQCQTIGLTLPPLEEQKAQIREDQIHLQSLSSQAFLETWGMPIYQHRERMQFYPVKNGNYVPRFRLPVGDVPPDWDSSIVSEEAYFLAYPDRGELLGFISDRLLYGDRLVYREQMPAEKVHEVGKMWKRESLFKTRMETDLLSPSKP